MLRETHNNKKSISVNYTTAMKDHSVTFGSWQLQQHLTEPTGYVSIGAQYTVRVVGYDNVWGIACWLCYSQRRTNSCTVCSDQLHGDWFRYL